MKSYVAQRLGIAILTLVGMSMVIFALLRLAPGDIVDKIQEEVDELRDVVATEAPIDQARAEEEMGDLLFAIANLSRKLGIEPETALRKANDKFTRRFGTLERAVADSGRAMKDMTLEELEAEWQRAKSQRHTE